MSTQEAERRAVVAFAGGAFTRAHARLVGDEIDLSSLQALRGSGALLQQARRVWQERVQSEYRSAQMMQRLLGDALAAGVPFDAHASLVEMISDELRHVALCSAVVRALGAEPCLPVPLDLPQPAAFLAMPAEARALAIGIAQLLVNETLSVAFIADLHERCRHPAIAAVLAATLGDEAQHDAFGVSFVRRTLAERPEPERARWCKVAEDALRPQREAAQRMLRELSPAERDLQAWPDEQLVALGLFSPQRQALVFQRAYDERLAPRLASLGLL